MKRPILLEPFGEQLELILRLHLQKLHSKLYNSVAAGAPGVKQNLALHGYDQPKVDRSAREGQPRRLPLMFQNDQTGVLMAAGQSAYRENGDEMSQNWRLGDLSGISGVTDNHIWPRAFSAEPGPLRTSPAAQEQRFGLDSQTGHGGQNYKNHQGMLYNQRANTAQAASKGPIGLGNHGFGGNYYNDQNVGAQQTQGWNAPQFTQKYTGPAQTNQGSNMFSANLFNMTPSLLASSVLSSSRTNVSNPSLTSQSPSHSLFSKDLPAYEPEFQESISEAEPLAKPRMESWSSDLEGSLEGSLLRSIWASLVEPPSTISFGKW